MAGGQEREQCSESRSGVQRSLLTDAGPLELLEPCLRQSLQEIGGQLADVGELDGLIGLVAGALNRGPRDGEEEQSLLRLRSAALG